MEQYSSRRSLGQTASTSQLSQQYSTTGGSSRKDVFGSSTDVSSAYRKQHLNDVLFPMPAPSTPSSWTVSDTSRRFPALARRKGQLPESILKTTPGRTKKARIPWISRTEGSKSLDNFASSQVMSGTLAQPQQEDDVASVQDFHKEDSRAILLPHFSGSDNAMLHAGITGGDISFRADVQASDKHLLSSYSELFEERSANFSRGETSTRSDGPDTLRVRVPGRQPQISASVMPGYDFVRDLESKLLSDHPALALSLNTSYMSLPSSRNETVLLADWIQRSLSALRTRKGDARVPVSKLESLDNPKNKLSTEWDGLPEAQVLSLAMTDMIRQVGAHCAERSALLAFLWNEMIDLFENRTNHLEDVIETYDSKMSILLAEAPRLRKQSRLFEDASKKAVFEANAARDAKDRYEIAKEDLTKLNERVNTVFARMTSVENYLDSRMRSIRWQKAMKISSAFTAKLKKRKSIDPSADDYDMELTGEEKLELLEEKLVEHKNKLKDFEDYAVKVAKKNTAIAHLKIAASISEDLQSAVDQMSIEKKNKSDLERKLNMFTSGNIDELEKQVSQSLLDLSLPEVAKLLSSISSEIGGGAMSKLSPEQIAKILVSLPPPRAADLIAHMDIPTVAYAFLNMADKPRLRIFGHVIPDVVSKIFTHMTLIEEEDSNFTLDLASTLVCDVDNDKKVKLLEGYSNKHAVHSMERLKPTDRVEVFNRINTESAIKLLMQSGRDSQQLASILSRCDESVVSKILECMLNESNKNFDAHQKEFACQLLLEFEPEFAANVILCTASLSKKGWPQASTWTHICSDNLDIDDTINVEGQCSRILLNIAQKNLHRAAEFLLKIRDRTFAATLLRILFEGMFGQGEIGLALIEQMVGGMNIPIDAVSLIQLLSNDMKVNHNVATTAIDKQKFGEQFGRNVIEKVPASLAVHFLSGSRIDAYNISCVLKHVKNEEKVNEIVKGLDNTLRELVMRYLAEAKEKMIQKKETSSKRESALIRRRSSAVRTKSIEELRKNIRPARRSMRRSMVSSQKPSSPNSIFQSYLNNKGNDDRPASRGEERNISPVLRRRSKIGEELAKLAEVKKITNHEEVIKRRESIKINLPAAFSAPLVRSTTPTTPTTPPSPGKQQLSQPEQDKVGSVLQKFDVVSSPFKTAVQLKELQERFLGNHRRQWFANHDTRLKVALAQVSDPSLEDKGALSPNKSKVKSLLSHGKGRSGEWLNRMIGSVLTHLIEHQQQHSGTLNHQLTFMTSMSFLDHTLESMHSEFLESYSTNIKVACMSGALRVASWNMHEAFLGYFHKQYGTGTIVEEYMASMLVTLKGKLQENNLKATTILNVIEAGIETPYVKNWKFMHRILWNMISNYWGGDVLARFVAALASVDSFVQAEQHKRSQLNITSLNYEGTSEWLCRRRAEIIADTVLGLRSLEAREIFEERITDLSEPVEKEEEEIYLDILENDVGGVVDETTLEQYNQRHGDSECCWKVLKAEFLYQLCLEARHYELHLTNAILDIFRLCDKDNNGYMDQKEAEEMLEECIAMLKLENQIRRTSKDERLKYNLLNFHTVFKQFWVTAVLVDESSGSTPPSSMHVIEKLVNEAKSMSSNPTLDWAHDVEEISFTGFSAAVRMSNVLRAYIQVFFTPPRENEVDLEDTEVFFSTDNMDDMSPQVYSRNASVAVITKRNSMQVKEQFNPILAKAGASEPILRGLLHRVQEEKHGPSMIKMYLKLLQDMSSIQMNRVRQLAYGPVVTPPEEAEEDEMGQQLYPSFSSTFAKSVKDAKYSMLLLNGMNFSEILSTEVKQLGRSSKVRELIDITKQLNDVSDSVKQALIGIALQRKLHKKKTEYLQSA